MTAFLVLPRPGVMVIRLLGDSRATGRMIAEIAAAAIASGDVPRGKVFDRRRLTVPTAG
jgi:hypothetical protein